MFDGGFIIGLIGALATVGSVIALIVKSRGENKNAAANAKAALDDRIDKRVSEQLEAAWKRLDEQDTKIEEQDLKIRQQDTKISSLETREGRRTGAITRILRAIAKQWPSGVAGPDLDPMDIAEIEETIPSSWIRPKKN